MSLSKQAETDSTRRGSAQLDAICEALGGYSAMLELLRYGVSTAVAQLLLKEVNCIFECRTCRELFRKIEEFLAHKLSCAENSESTESQSISERQMGDDDGDDDDDDDDDDVLDLTKPEKKAEESVIDLTKHDKELEDEVIDLSTQHLQQQAPKQAQAIRVSGFPERFRREGIIATQDVPKLGFSTVGIAQRLKSKDTSKKDTAVIGEDGQIIATGTSEEMENFEF